MTMADEPNDPMMPPDDPPVPQEFLPPVYDELPPKPDYTYSLTHDGEAVLRSDGAIIPADPSNLDWQIYQEWLADDNIPIPAVIPPSPVPTCLVWQLQAAITSEQWNAVQLFIANSGNRALQAFASQGVNPIPADSTTLAILAEAAGIDPSTLPELVARAGAISIP